MYEVIVVGGGLAGLSAALALEGREVLLLEAKPRLGGRVWTRGGADLGACFALPDATFPPGFRPVDAERELGPLALASGDGAILADHPRELLERSDEREAFARSRASGGDPSTLPGPALALVNALFRRVHPGDIRAYARARQRDALAPILPAFRPGGNGAVIEAYREALERAHVRISLGREVVAIDEDAHRVRVAHRAPGLEELAIHEAELLVLATTADVARRLLPASPHPALELARYASYTVVALRGARRGDARAILRPGGAPEVVLQLGSTALAYFGDDTARAAARLDDAALVALTGRALGLRGALDGEVARFAAAGTILSPALARAKAKGPGLHAGPRVLLAGDYMGADPEWGYGTLEAVSSGRAAAARARELLGA